MTSKSVKYSFTCKNCGHAQIDHYEFGDCVAVAHEPEDENSEAIYCDCKAFK